MPRRSVMTRFQVNKSSVLGLFLLFVLWSQPALAQSSKNNWDSLLALRPGTKLKIKTKTRETFVGTLKGVTADSISILPSKGSANEVEIKRGDVAEIRRKSAARTAGFAALLGGLGFAGG